MSLIELTIIIFISLGILDKDKIGKIFRVFNSSNSDQVRKVIGDETIEQKWVWFCLLYTSPSPRDATLSRMPSSA